MRDQDGKAALVTGASGFIGGRLAARLLAAGWRVQVLARDPGRLSAGLRGKVAVHVGDLGDEGALVGAVRGVSVVFHCAANVRTWDRTPAYYRANVAGVRNLLAALDRPEGRSARLVHLSTVDVYGFPVAACDEQGATPPGVFAYGESKRQGEALVRAWGEAQGRRYTIVRPGNVLGPGSPFILRIGQALRSGVMLTVDGGRTHAGVIDVDNLVDCLLWIAGADRAAGQAYNARDPGDVNWAQVIEALHVALDARGRVVDLPYGVANVLAGAVEGAWRVARPGREPPLHRLLVRLFGRTCGHSAAKLHDHSALGAGIGFAESIERSVHWLRESEIPGGTDRTGRAKGSCP